MKRFKKITRQFLFICLIILACVGVGISGGVPIPFSRNKRDSEKDKIELIENQEEESDSIKDEIKG